MEKTQTNNFLCKRKLKYWMTLAFKIFHPVVQMIGSDTEIGCISIESRRWLWKLQLFASQMVKLNHVNDLTGE